MKFNSDTLYRYMGMAPLALAFERELECRILSRIPFERPILDIGCGEGLFANMLFAEKITTGIDPNPYELARAQELAAYEELIRCTGAAIPKPDGYYRTIFSNSVLEHIPQLEPVLREAHRLLAPGGRFYLTVPSANFERYTLAYQMLARLGLATAAGRFTHFFNRFWQHYHCYSPQQWRILVQRAGFEVVESYTYAPKSVCLLNDFLVPFSLIELMTKKVINRWTLFPPIRRIVLYPVYHLARKWLRDADRAVDGGLVFLALTKT